jgi:tRNA (guanine-N7-)-methyltransferase
MQAMETIVQQRNSHTMAWPTNWAEIFGAERPLIVEIGFGNADYLIALAKTHPECNVIGFELSIASMNKAEHKIRKNKLTNAVAIYSTGETALNHLFTPASIREIHINYPDPWFKTRHAQRRIMQRDTLDAIASRLETGGLFYLATDILDYAEMSHEILKETPALDNLLSAPYVHEFPERLITTKYEAKGFAEGRAGHYFKYRRNEKAAPLVPVKEDLPVPHVVIATPLSPQEIAAQVGREAFHKGNLHAALHNGYWNPRNDAALFEITIVEPTIEQHIALILHRREEGDGYVLKYATFGMPRPTEGMHFATKALAEWIVSLHPDSKIITESIKA